MLANIQPAPPDAILGLTEAFKADRNPSKVNLGVGVYKDAAGNTPVLESVRAAERILLEIEKTKSYLPISGSPGYGRSVRGLVFGESSALIDNGRAVTCQAPGGTGALKVGADFLRKMYADSRVWLSSPTWANHRGIFCNAGFPVSEYSYYEEGMHGLDFVAMCADLQAVPADDIVVLHACCHNPTGADLDASQWMIVADIARERGWIPFLDFAYQGFGSGLDEDACGVRILAEAGVEFLVASSFSKNFSIYYERAGALTLVLDAAAKASAAFSHIEQAARTNYSNPPAHGALIVETILNDPSLRLVWEDEVTEMRRRLAKVRTMFVERMHQLCPDRDFSFIEKQWGMFSYSGLTRDQVAFLRKERSIYIVDSGRISTAGIIDDNIDYLCESIRDALAPR